MRLVERHLDGPAPHRLVYRLAHRIRDGIRVHHDFALGIARGTAYGLDKRSAVTQETLFIRIQDGDQGHLGQIEPLSQQIDAHEHIDLALPQISEYLDAVERCGIRMHVVDLDARVEQILGQVLRHSFGERGDQHALVPRRPDADLVEQVVDLAAHRAHVDLRIEQARGSDDLLDVVLAHPQLVIARSGADVDELRNPGFEFIEPQRPVIKRRGKAKAVLHQGDLARPVALVHTANLRHRDRACPSESNR